MTSAAARALVSLVLAATTSCAGIETYQPATVGPRARLTFASPYLEDRFLAFDELHLEISEADATCNRRALGRLSLSSSTRTSTTYVVANRRAYFRVWQRSYGMLGESESRLDFSFVPEDGAEYRIEHIDNPARLRVGLSKLASDGSTQSLDLQNPACGT